MVRVRWGETDPLGIAFYPNFFAWFDLAAHELLRRPGGDVASIIAGEEYALPIVESGARFIAPAFYDDEVVITSAVTEVRARGFRLEHAVDRDGRRLASGFEVRVVARGRPAGEGGLETVRVPDDLRAWLAGEA